MLHTNRSFSDVSPRVSLQVLFVKEYHLTICAFTNILLKSFVPEHVSRQLISPREYLPTDRHIAQYIWQKYINSIHIGNQCNHV
jgi:hypothetical protein